MLLPGFGFANLLTNAVENPQKFPFFAAKMPCNFSPGWGLMTAPQKQPGIAAPISAAALSAILVGWTTAAAADFEESSLRRCATGNLFGPNGPRPGHWRSGAKAAQIRVPRRKQQSSFFLFPADRPFLSGLRQPPPPNLKSAPYIRAPTLFGGKGVSRARRPARQGI